MSIEAGDTVVFHCQGYLQNGQSLEDENDNQPYTMQAGSHDSESPLVNALGQALVGLDQGDKKTVTVQADNAFGQYRDELVIPVDEGQFQNPVSEGDPVEVELETESGPTKRRAVVKGKDGGQVNLDLNHPLAGEDIKFDISIVSVEKQS